MPPGRHLPSLEGHSQRDARRFPSSLVLTALEMSQDAFRTSRYVVAGSPLPYRQRGAVRGEPRQPIVRPADDRPQLGRRAYVPSMRGDVDRVVAQLLVQHDVEHEPLSTQHAFRSPYDQQWCRPLDGHSGRPQHELGIGQHRGVAAHRAGQVPTQQVGCEGTQVRRQPLGLPHAEPGPQVAGVESNVHPTGCTGRLPVTLVPGQSAFVNHLPRHGVPPDPPPRLQLRRVLIAHR